MIGLEPLLAALREAGLPVGVAEMARLQRVFALSPESGDARRLQSVLRAVLVKSADDRAVFERIFETWLLQADHEVRLRDEAPQPEPVRAPQAPRPRRLRALVNVLAPLLLVLVILALVSHFEVRPPKLGPGKLSNNPVVAPPPPSPTPTPAAPRTPEAIRQQTFTTFVPVLSVKPGPWPGWLPLLLACAAFTVASELWRASRRRNWMPEPAPEPARKGPPRVFLSPPEPAGLQLLLPREEEALVWGIGHFVAEEPTRRLDLPATVRATARAAGLPTLSFHAARYPREVWLWIDETADDPAIPRLVEEVSAALAAHGLPVERALFRGVPDWLVHADGQVFAPNEVDERRDAALVAILTDGRVLTRHYAADDRRVGLDALLRSLSHWPRLAFVDFSAEPGPLGAILAPHFIERIVPGELAGFLGADEALRRRAAVEAYDVAVWAAACALAPSSVDEPRAFELRRRLGLTASPWALSSLRAEAPGPAGRLCWPAPLRARRINWLRAAEAQSKDGLDPGSLLGQALTFWEEVYDRELEERTAGEAGKLWQDTPAHQHLLMERALLALWNQEGAAEAIRELHSLHGGALRESIEEHLGHLAPLDWGGPDDLHLPWRWEARTGAEPFMLQEMHLGGGMPPVTLRRPGRLWVGLAVCLGLAAGALAMAALSDLQGLAWPPPPVLLHGPGKPADALEGFLQLPAGSWKVAVGTRKMLVAAQGVPPAARIEVRWEEHRLPCVASLADGEGEVWNCGTVATPPRLSETIGRRVVVLAAAPSAWGARALAVDLLDSGSADVVLISRHWKQSGNIFTTEAYLMGQEPLLVVPNSEWRDLSQALRFEGTKPLREVWTGVRPLIGDRSFLLRGLLTCRNGETITERGRVFVRICPGTFMMGSANDEREAEENEKPAHKVSLSEYWIGQTEVTQGQYGERRASKLPVTTVDWNDAKRFCEQRGWRLPTEAEWEYAARAGTKTAWSFGDDERNLDKYAWFGELINGQPHPVGTKKPNPWGLYDMHGNVWEWVADWYAPYKAGSQTDPKGPTAGIARALRGGAFENSPKLLCSACRYGNVPEGRNERIGFRCARNPRRQP